MSNAATVAVAAGKAAFTAGKESISAAEGTADAFGGKGTAAAAVVVPVFVPGRECTSSWPRTPPPPVVFTPPGVRWVWSLHVGVEWPRLMTWAGPAGERQMFFTSACHTSNPAQPLQYCRITPVQS
jgi:hypothetical protein